MTNVKCMDKCDWYLNRLCLIDDSNSIFRQNSQRVNSVSALIHSVTSTAHLLVSQYKTDDPSFWFVIILMTLRVIKLMHNRLHKPEYILHANVNWHKLIIINLAENIDLPTYHPNINNFTFGNKLSGAWFLSWFLAVAYRWRVSQNFGRQNGDSRGRKVLVGVIKQDSGPALGTIYNKSHYE